MANRSLVTKFTTNTTNYELLTDSNVLAKLNALGFNSTLTGGFQGSFVVFVNSATQIKINNASFYDDFISDTVYSVDGDNLINSIKIKDTGISGTIKINIR